MWAEFNDGCKGNTKTRVLCCRLFLFLWISYSQLFSKLREASHWLYAKHAGLWTPFKIMWSMQFTITLFFMWTYRSPYLYHGPLGNEFHPLSFMHIPLLIFGFFFVLVLSVIRHTYWFRTLRFSRLDWLRCFHSGFKPLEDWPNWRRSAQRPPIVSLFAAYRGQIKGQSDRRWFTSSRFGLRV